MLVTIRVPWIRKNYWAQRPQRQSFESTGLVALSVTSQLAEEPCARKAEAQRPQLAEEWSRN